MPAIILAIIQVLGEMDASCNIDISILVKSAEDRQVARRITYRFHQSDIQRITRLPCAYCMRVVSPCVRARTACVLYPLRPYLAIPALLLIQHLA